MHIILEYLLVFIAGVFIGNFTTTVLYRLPRGIILYGFNTKTTQPPFCSRCKHLLKFYEFLPIFSWISTRGFCNYCHMPITVSYFLLEFMGGVFAVLCVVLYGDNIENFIIMFCFYMLATLAFFIVYEHGVAFKEITGSLLLIGILHRTLVDNSLLPWLLMLSLASIVSLYILKDNLQDVYRQQIVHIILPASVWLLFPWNIGFFAGVLLLFFIKERLYCISLLLLGLMVVFQSI
ncbi:MAG: prepilin peptidase [Rickettsiaceae bacterium]|nr:prepilin peptidase [Rickettsiaceae bacterium]MDP4832908.1 prepilin peptidase [Rickettsiaceae bacterium]MDP5021137.1 prepilin peptidase [Rickettsiaceae bacterium]MDP5082699.1 prepilin peptidase [Rickettsiaceae bacterium]